MESSNERQGRPNLKDIKKIAKSNGNEELLQHTKKRIANQKEVSKDDKD
jgi:hypothetical protein